MPNAKNILIAIDDSTASYRAVTYVGSIIGGREDFRICLLHASPPLPRELLEFGGSSDPQQEERAEARIHAEQARWLEAVAQAAEPVFTRAKVGGQAVLGRQNILPTPWLTERHGYDPT